MKAYYREWDEDGYYLVPLQPTGRWRERKDEYGTTIYIEHRYFLILKKWVSEKSIEFREEPKDIFYSCKGKR